MDKMDINHFFSTPVFILNDNKHAENIDQLLEEVYAWRDSDEEEVVRSNNGGWHSPTDIFKKQSPGLRRINNIMISCFTKCTTSIAPEFDPSKHEMKGEGWVNVNPQYGFNVPHDHPGYTWSGVYYASLPERKDKSRSGCIELLDPRTNTAAMATDIARSSQYFSPKRTLFPKDGMILIFPSYLRHWVYPNEEEQDRISFAYNFKFAPKTVSQQMQPVSATDAGPSGQTKNRGPKKKKGGKRKIVTK